MIFGEHRLGDKGVGYEESVRVPLVMATSSFQVGTTGALVAMNLDLPATIQALRRRTPGRSRSRWVPPPSTAD